MNSPAEIRRELRALRRALPEDIAREHSAAIARRLAGSGIFSQSRRIAAYLANDGEVGTEDLIRVIWEQGKDPYLPILRFAPEKCLWFGLYRPETVLAPNKYRIPEPSLGPDTLAEPWYFDLALVPLVAFDLAGHRIGMGGGYYDRTFAYLKERGRSRAPILIGLAFECQKREGLPAEPWDVPLDGVVTERAFYSFKNLPGLPAAAG
jgi:5-formyltetrahydrofolate cyclo-ligase